MADDPRIGSQSGQERRGCVKPLAEAGLADKTCLSDAPELRASAGLRERSQHLPSSSARARESKVWPDARKVERWSRRSPGCQGASRRSWAGSRLGAVAATLALGLGDRVRRAVSSIERGGIDAGRVEGASTRGLNEELADPLEEDSWIGGLGHIVTRVWGAMTSQAAF